MKSYILISTLCWFVVFIAGWIANYYGDELCGTERFYVTTWIIISGLLFAFGIKTFFNMSDLGY